MRPSRFSRRFVTPSLTAALRKNAVINFKKVLDEKKIPYYSCIKEFTIDDNKLNDDVVTIRNRDTMEQETIKVSEIASYVESKLKF